MPLGLFLALCLALPAAAQTPATPGTPAALADTAARVRERALSGSGAYDILESLTTETGPRPAGSPAFARAKDWAIAKMTSLGFKNVHAEPFTILAWFKGAETAEVTAPFPQPLVITGLGRSVSTPPEGVEAEIVIFKTFEELQSAPANSLTGKIAVLTERMGANDSPTGYGAANRWRRKGPVEAGKRGAVGFLIRSLATNDDRSPHSGALNYDDDAPKIPSAALSGTDADQIERIARRGK
ncbi:MAG: peptidase M28 family protein, partial [Caulobacteraceae bacterium]